MPHVSAKIFRPSENDNISFLGKKIGGRFWHANIFVMLYAISPLSTTALFTAAGMAHVNPWNVLPDFAIGKFLGDAWIIFTAKVTANVCGQRRFASIESKPGAGDAFSAAIAVASAEGQSLRDAGRFASAAAALATTTLGAQASCHEGRNCRPISTSSLPLRSTGDKRSSLWRMRFFYRNWLRLRRRRIRNLVAFGLLAAFVIDEFASSTRHLPVTMCWVRFRGHVIHLQTRKEP
jgi:hypothetical protein